MRLIGEFSDEKQVFAFQAFLQKEGIQSLYDLAGQTYRLWVVEEDDFDKAYSLFVQWQKDPGHIQYISPPVKQDPKSGHAAQWKVRVELPRQGPSFSLTNIIIIFCFFIFILNSVQEVKLEEQKGLIAIEMGVTPLEKALLFDYPESLVKMEKVMQEYPIKSREEIKELSAEGQAAFKQAEDAPTWKGISDVMMKRSWKEYDQLPAGTLFGKIRQGEVWRLITPVILHANLIHILFNMFWLWVLSKQMEQRIGALRLLLFSVVVGVVSNVAQYLMSGPIFIGYSGIVMGMVGFIWMRQKKAPWEGYPLQPLVVKFIVIYIVALLALELVVSTLHFFHITELALNIANTAHIVGGVCGMILARIPFFSRVNP